MDSGSQPVTLSRGDLSLYRDIAKVDQNPGLLNGVLSLILSNTNLGSEFQQKETNAASYFNSRIIIFVLYILSNKLIV